ncbi:hypothetical protein, partial [Glutamicibacter sp.]|uniref:hypothetical protein n=1 Tax=Glutamicibacter sp. TaxID=1931995 RepID=UPI002FC657F1
RNLIFNHCVPLKTKKLRITAKVLKGQHHQQAGRAGGAGNHHDRPGSAATPSISGDENMSINDRSEIKGFKSAGAIKKPRCQRCNTAVSKFPCGKDASC